MKTGRMPDGGLAVTWPAEDRTASFAKGKRRRTDGDHWTEAKRRLDEIWTHTKLSLVSRRRPKGSCRETELSLGLRRIARRASRQAGRRLGGHRAVRGGSHGERLDRLDGGPAAATRQAADRTASVSKGTHQVTIRSGCVVPLLRRTAVEFFAPPALAPTKRRHSTNMWVVACIEYLDDYKSRGQDWARLGAVSVYRSEAEARRGRRDVLVQLLVQKDLVGLELEGGYGPEGFWKEMARHLIECTSVPSEEDAAQEAARLLRLCPDKELESFYAARVKGESVPRRWSVDLRHVGDAALPEGSRGDKRASDNSLVPTI